MRQETIQVSRGGSFVRKCKRTSAAMHMVGANRGAGSISLHFDIIVAMLADSILRCIRSIISRDGNTSLDLCHIGKDDSW